MKAYAGIGSRQTPPAVLARMEELAGELARQGWLLRSGGAEGADASFERGCDTAGGAKEIFLPWPKWRGRSQGEPGTPIVPLPVLAHAREIAEMHHPSWHYLSPAAKAFHTRNVFQVVGQDLNSPVHLVLCWTPGAQAGGGTGQAIRHARSLRVPVFDLADPVLDTWNANEFIANARKPGAGAA